MSHDHRKVHWEPTEHTKSNTDTTNRQTDNKRKVATDNALNLPAGCSQSQLPPRHDTGPWPYAGLNPVTRASRLPGTILGLGLTLNSIQN